MDKAYVDKTFNNINWFKYREDTVKKVSMDSTDETYDAIRAMLAKLDDPFTKFLEPEKYASLTESTMSANITGRRRRDGVRRTRRALGSRRRRRRGAHPGRPRGPSGRAFARPNRRRGRSIDGRTDDVRGGGRAAGSREQ